ncbi:anthranilate synthase component II [Candidatus Amarolinea aalborgensis]|uniref:anthranilate synthase component II n=1 Tax=Candidatus Amarolinea aalborgensis TaxID=2249329 RepID=UPI003BF98CAB
MIAFIDNYDSFTYNLVQYVGEIIIQEKLGDPHDLLRVWRNDQVTVDELAALAPSHIIVSPGPGTPEQDSGVSNAVIERFYATTPILGVCLGHQCMGYVFGGQVVRAPRLMHGKTSPVYHTGRGIFNGLPSPFTATRYHSLIVLEPLPSALEVMAFTAEGEVMGLRHRQYPHVVGVQFHPESILTEGGKDLLRNFLALKRMRV